MTGNGARGVRIIDTEGTRNDKGRIFLFKEPVVNSSTGSVYRQL